MQKTSAITVALATAIFVASAMSGNMAAGEITPGGQSIELAQNRGGGANGRPSPEKRLKVLDQDGDGKISRSEFRGSDRHFGVIDGNGDGFITLEEIKSRESASRRKSEKLAEHPLADWYRGLPIILTHTHILPCASWGDDWRGATKNALEQMDKNNIALSIVMFPPHSNFDRDKFGSLLEVAQRHPNRIKVLGGGRSLNPMINGIHANRVDDGDKEKFTRIAEDMISKGVIGFGETAALHLSFFRGHPYEEVRPDHPLYLLLADIAAKHNVPIDLHMEAVGQKMRTPNLILERSSANPDYLEENIAGLERLLAHNRKAKIVWVHLGADSTGERPPSLVRRLLRAHPNLFMSIKFSRQGSAASRVFKGDGALNPKWAKVITGFSDRITLGSDSWYQPDNPTRQMPQNQERTIAAVRLPILPPAVARKVAFENAQRIFNLKVIDPESYPLPAGAAPAVASGQKRQKQRVHRNIRRFDKDGDGRVARAEFPGNSQRFSRIDTNKDQLLSSEEFKAFHAKRQNQSGPQEGQRQQRQKRQGPEANNQRSGSSSPHLLLADKRALFLRRRFESRSSEIPSNSFQRETEIRFTDTIRKMARSFRRCRGTTGYSGGNGISMTRPDFAGRQALKGAGRCVRKFLNAPRRIRFCYSVVA